MDQSNREVILRGQDLLDVKTIVCGNGDINEVEVDSRGWGAFEIDDKAIFDEDAIRLSRAFLAEGALNFFVATTDSVVNSSEGFVAYKFESTPKEIEFFQGEKWCHINLDDCILFNLPMTCVVRRPGNVDTTRFFGGKRFIQEISGGSK